VPDGVLEESVVPFPARRALTVGATGCIDRLERRPDRRRANKGREGESGVGTPAVVERSDLCPRQRQPLEQCDASTVSVMPSPDSNVATVIHDERHDHSQASIARATLPGWEHRSFELGDRHDAEARERPRSAQDALSDVSERP
jgi:hypothetical protein